MLVFSAIILAQLQYPIPDSCKPLAKREGYPLIMSEQEEAYAKSQLKLADQSDPLVSKCKKAIEAVDRMKTMGK